MGSKHQIYLISDSTGETIDRIFLAIKAQFQDFEYEDHQYSFTRTENQIQKILDLDKSSSESNSKDNSGSAEDFVLKKIKQN